MIDIHSHILPAVDDGSRSIQESIALLRVAVRDGIQEMVLTPHIFVGRWDNNLTMLRPRFEAFRRLVQSKSIDIQLHLGAEVHLLFEAIDLIRQGEIPMVGEWEGEPALLLELHDGRIPPFTLDAIRYLRGKGVRPIIAHPERNKAVMNDPTCLEPLLAQGCLFQITAASVTGGFGERAARASMDLLDRSWVHFVASDAHNLRSRPPLMSDARSEIARRHGVDIAHALTFDNPAQLLSRYRNVASVGPQSESRAAGSASSRRIPMVRSSTDCGGID